MTDARKRARTEERLRAGGKRAGEDVLPKRRREAGAGGRRRAAEAPAEKRAGEDVPPKRRRRNARAASGKLEMRRLLPSPEERTA